MVASLPSSLFISFLCFYNSSPEYAVVENPDGTTSPVPGITYGPPVHPNFLPVGSLSGHHPHSVHNPMEDPEPYASSTLVLPSFRKPQFSDSSSEWTNSWNSQEHRKKTERKSHFEQGRKDCRDEGRGSLGGGGPTRRGIVVALFQELCFFMPLFDMHNSCEYDKAGIDCS